MLVSSDVDSDLDSDLGGNLVNGSAAPGVLELGVDDSTEELVRRYRPPLIRFANRLGATDPEGVADLALFDVVRAKPRLDSTSERSLRAYLYRAARGHAIAESRRRRPEDPTDPATMAAVPIDDGSEQVEAALLVEELLGGLTSDQRQVIEKLYFNDVEPTVVADELQTSRANVYQIRHRAILTMRKTLQAMAVIAGLLWLLNSASSRNESLEVTPVNEVDSIDEAPAQTTTSWSQASTVSGRLTTTQGPAATISSSTTTTTPVTNPSVSSTAATAPVTNPSVSSTALSTRSTLTTESSAATGPPAAAEVRPAIIELDIGLAGSSPKPGWTAFPAANGSRVAVDDVTFALSGPGLKSRSTNSSIDVNGDFAYVDGADTLISLRISDLPAGVYRFESWHSDRLLPDRPAVSIEFGAVGATPELIGHHNLSVAPVTYSITSDGTSEYELVFRPADNDNPVVRLNGLRITRLGDN